MVSRNSRCLSPSFITIFRPSSLLKISFNLLLEQVVGYKQSIPKSKLVRLGKLAQMISNISWSIGSFPLAPKLAPVSSLKALNLLNNGKSLSNTRRVGLKQRSSSSSSVQRSKALLKLKLGDFRYFSNLTLKILRFLPKDPSFWPNSLSNPTEVSWVLGRWAFRPSSLSEDRCGRNFVRAGILRGRDFDTVAHLWSTFIL